MFAKFAMGDKLAITMVQYLNRRAVSTSNRTYATQTRQPQPKQSHYTVLGIKHDATQSEVKSAYYNLSKLYHPDTSSKDSTSSEANLKKFRDITKAYEVLGNVRSRKQYDMGLPTFKPPLERKRSMGHQFYEAQRVKNRMSEPMYNFDEWIKEHYGDVLRRQQDFKNYKAAHVKREVDAERQFGYEQVVILLLFFLFSYEWLKGFEDYDQPRARAMREAQEKAAAEAAAAFAAGPANDK